MCCCTTFMHSAPKLVRQRYNPNFLLFATSFYGAKKLYLVIFHWKKLTLTMFYFESACSVFTNWTTTRYFLGWKTTFDFNHFHGLTVFQIVPSKLSLYEYKLQFSEKQKWVCSFVWLFMPRKHDIFQLFKKKPHLRFHF